MHHVLLYSCRNCAYQEETHNPCVYKHDLIVAAKCVTRPFFSLSRSLARARALEELAHASVARAQGDGGCDARSGYRSDTGASFSGSPPAEHLAHIALTADSPGGTSSARNGASRVRAERKTLQEF